MFQIPVKRLALRRASPCGTVGKLSRGLNRASIQRAGDTSDAGAGRPSLKRCGIYRVGETPTCVSCVMIFETTLYPTEQGPIHNYTAPFLITNTSIPYETFGTGILRIVATADLRSTSFPAHTVTVGLIVKGSVGSPNYASLEGPATNVYQNVQLLTGDVPPFTNPYSTWTNPGTPLRTDFFTNNTDAGFQHVDSFFKNVHIQIFSGCDG